MSASAAFFSKALAAVVAATIAGMFTAIAWLAVQVARGRNPLPPAPAAREPDRAVPWGWRSVVLVVLTLFLVGSVVKASYLGYRDLTQTRLKPPPAAPARVATAGAPKAAAEEPEISFAWQMLLISVINLVLLALVPFVLHLTSGATAADLGFRAGPFLPDVRLGALTFLAATPVVIGINALALLVWKSNRHPVELMLRKDASPGVIALAFLAAAVLAPAAEELLFRGVLQAWLRRVFVAPVKPRLKLGTADDALPGDDPEFSAPVSFVPEARRPRVARILPVVLTSAFFAVVHKDQMPAPIPIFALSLLLGWLYEHTGRLAAPIVLHSLFNAFNTTLMVLVLVTPTPGRPTGKPGKRPRVSPEKTVVNPAFQLARPVQVDKF